MSSLSLSADWAGKDAESLLWLASYPRSGNTFTRLLLANYFSSGDGAYDINQLHGFLPPDTSSLLWGELFSDVSEPNTPELTWGLRPKFIQHYRKMDKPFLFSGFKTHTANLPAFGTGGFDFRTNDRIIYIVRHPLDVVLSYADFNNRGLDSAIDVFCQSGVYVKHDYVGGFELRGSWAEHVLSWVENPPCPLLVIRYEELRIATAEALTAILSFLGARVIPERVQQAVEASRFDAVQQQEASKSFNEAPATARSGKFFREGKILQWLKELSPEQAYRLADGCAAAMDRVGYTHPREVYFDGRNAFKPMKL